MNKQLIIGSLMFLAPFVANAGGVESLRSFIDGTVSMRAQFHQTIMDNKGRKIQEVNGSMQLERPGKFRWDYSKPYIQQIVGDGKQVWLYDPDLNQVTVRELSKALGSSPAALLAGSKEIEKNFDLKDESRQGELDWVLATPKANESGFEKVYLGFRKDTIQEMELHDSFGNVTVIAFSKLERNPRIAANTFYFRPPSGADVVGE